jgi:hypothetical protein
MFVQKSVKLNSLGNLSVDTESKSDRNLFSVFGYENCIQTERRGKTVVVCVTVSFSCGLRLVIVCKLWNVSKETCEHSVIIYWNYCRRNIRLRVQFVTSSFALHYETLKAQYFADTHIGLTNLL